MPDRDVDTALHIVHDLTQSIRLGGALMGAVSVDAAASAAAMIGAGARMEEEQRPRELLRGVAARLGLAP